MFRNQPITKATSTTPCSACSRPARAKRSSGNIADLVQSWQGFGILGLVSLFFVAAGLFESLEWSINGAMGSRRKVGFLKRRLLTRSPT